MLQVLVQAASLILILGVGYGFKHIGWASSGDFPMLAKAVLYVTLPAMLIIAFDDFEFTPRLLILTALGFIITLSLHVIGYLLARKGTAQERAFALLNTGSFNIGAFTTPYISLFIGSYAVVFSSLFDVGGAIAAAGVAYAWASAVNSEGQGKPLGQVILKALSNPVLITYLTLLVMNVFHLSFPRPIITLVAPIGLANPFLAMFMVGVGLEISLPSTKRKVAFKYLASRYLFLILVGTALWFLVPVDRDIRMIVCVVLASPIAVMIAAFTDELGGDSELSTFMISISVLVGAIAMPALFLLLSH